MAAGLAMLSVCLNGCWTACRPIAGAADGRFSSASARHQPPVQAQCAAGGEAGVVAADEGLKPQTIESIDLAKETGVPVVVAINKMDKPGADVDMVKRALAEHELTPDDWGGDTICVPCSAKTGEGIDTLLEMVLLVSDMKQFKSHPTRPGVGTVIESHLDPGQGVIANILVNA